VASLFRARASALVDGEEGTSASGELIPRLAVDGEREFLARGPAHERPRAQGEVERPGEICSVRRQCALLKSGAFRSV